jgi:hypothetical protein
MSLIHVWEAYSKFSARCGWRAHLCHSVSFSRGCDAHSSPYALGHFLLQSLVFTSIQLWRRTKCEAPSPFFGERNCVRIAL